MKPGIKNAEQPIENNCNLFSLGAASVEKLNPGEQL
jgi:hypothetical protein